MILKRTIKTAIYIVILLLFNTTIAQTNTDDYQVAINSADEYFSNKDYINAKASYQYASRLKPDEQYPRDKLKETMDRLRDKMVVMEQFNAIVSDADRHFRLKEYEQAKQKYKEAEKVLPGESYPKDKIAEINEIVTNNEVRQAEYDEALTNGEQYIKFKKYEKAKIEFENASKVFPEEQYPKDKISELELIIEETAKVKAKYNQVIANADRLLNLKYYENAKQEYEKAALAKPDEDYPKSKIEEIEIILVKKNEFDQLVEEADELSILKDLESARIKYETALNIYPAESYPKGMIEKINTSLNSGTYTDNEEIIKEEEISEPEIIISDQQIKQNSYNQIVANADKLFAEKKYNLAKDEYQKALELMPDEKYPKNRIAEIITLLAAVTKEDSGYDNAISKGDNSFALKQYQEAKLSFMKASNIKPNEQYPKDKIREIEELVDNQNSVRAEYNRIIGAADRMFESNEYDKAKAKYNEALALLPDEQYPKDKLKEISDVILAGELAIQETYNNFITEADELLSGEQYNDAIIKYREALKYKPDEEYPVQKISEIEHLINDFETLKAKYTGLIEEADRLFKAKEYQDAKPKYVEASAIFPEEEYPKSKIEEINLVHKANMQKIQNDYDKAIADADKFFSASVFDKALDLYRNAKGIKADELYPDEMIDKILKILDQNAVRDLLSSPSIIDDNTQEQFSFPPVSVSDRKSNFLYIKAKNITGSEFKVVLGYGKSGSKNGGFVIPIASGNEMKEFIIPIGKQYSWFSENNDWISLTPQGGSLEVSLIKITKGQ